MEKNKTSYLRIPKLVTYKVETFNKLNENRTWMMNLRLKPEEAESDDSQLHER